MAFAFAIDQNIAEDGSVIKAAWTGGAAGDTGAGLQFIPWADASVQVKGTISGSTVTIEGSNDSTNGVDGNWDTLDDAKGAALSLTVLTSSLKQIVQRPRWIRCAVTGGTGSAIAVTLIMRRANPLRT